VKVLIVGGTLSGKTGDTNAIKSIANELAQTEEVFVFPILPVFVRQMISPNGSYKFVKKTPSLSIIFFCVKSSFRWLKRVAPYLRCSLRDCFRYFLSLYHLALLRRDLPVLKPDIVHVHGISLEMLPFIDYLVNKFPLMVTCHGISDYSEHDAFTRANLEQDVLKKLVAHNIMITAVSSAVKQEAVTRFDIPLADIAVVRNGVDVERFASGRGTSKEGARSRFRLPRRASVIIQVGTLNTRKNHIAVLRALASMELQLRAQLCYLIVGDGKERDNLLRYVRMHKLEQNVVFAGQVSDSELIALYLLSDFFVLPSISEGLPLVFLEALAAGLPIITFSDVEGVEEVYRPNCMQLVSDRSTTSLVSAIQIATKTQWDRQSITDYARSWDWKTVGKTYLDLYRTSIQASRGNSGIGPLSMG